MTTTTTTPGKTAAPARCTPPRRFGDPALLFPGTFPAAGAPLRGQAT